MVALTMLSQPALIALAVSSASAPAVLMTTTQSVFGLQPETALAGLAGAVGMVLCQKAMGARETCAVAFCGVVSALYLTPYVASKLGVVENRALVSCVLGVVGIFVFRRVVDIAQNPQSIVDIVRSRKWLDLLKSTERPENVTSVRVVENTSTTPAPVKLVETSDVKIVASQQPVPVIVADHVASSIPDKPPE